MQGINEMFGKSVNIYFHFDYKNVQLVIEVSVAISPDQLISRQISTVLMICPLLRITY